MARSNVKLKEITATEFKQDKNKATVMMTLLMMMIMMMMMMILTYILARKFQQKITAAFEGF